MTTKSKEEFQKLYSFNNRADQSKNIREKYKGKVPIILHGLKFVAKNPTMPKTKFLVGENQILNEFLQVIKKYLFLKPSEALFFFVNGKIPLMNSKIRDLYERESDCDGFLYLDYSIEEVFG